MLLGYFFSLNFAVLCFSECNRGMEEVVLRRQRTPPGTSNQTTVSCPEWARQYWCDNVVNARPVWFVNKYYSILDRLLSWLIHRFDHILIAENFCRYFWIVFLKSFGLAIFQMLSITDHQQPKTGETSEPLIAKQEQYGKSMKMWTSCMIISSPQGDTQGPYIFRTKTKKEVHDVHHNDFFGSHKYSQMSCHDPPDILLLFIARSSLVAKKWSITDLTFFHRHRIVIETPMPIASRVQSQMNSWLNVLSSSSLSATKSGWAWIKPKDEKRWLSLHRGQLKMFLSEVCTIAVRVVYFISWQ